MRLLVIEDEEKIQKMIKVSLESESFCVDTASRGEEGSFMARVHDYDCIILDYQLPDMHGIAVCKEIREVGKATPILALSVVTELDTKVAFLNAGADDYLTKPFSFAELTARIRALLRRPTSITGPILKIDDLVLDTIKRTVFRGDNEIILTRKEYSLLEYLMRNQGVPLSRGAIMEHVWDMSVDPFSNTIDAHILSLRKKLNQGKKKDLIQTVTGTGYKIAL